MLRSSPNTSRAYPTVWGRLKGRFREAVSAERQEEGSAVVEFTFLALLLMVPLVYFIITVGRARSKADPLRWWELRTRPQRSLSPSRMPTQRRLPPNRQPS
ncbi:MAG: hypothetical protein NVS2B15_11140 [Pseudarthrobacter sp.]